MLREKLANITYGLAAEGLQPSEGVELILQAFGEEIVGMENPYNYNDTELPEPGISQGLCLYAGFEYCQQCLLSLLTNKEVDHSDH